MGILSSIRKASRVPYACDECGELLRDGEPFGILGIMGDKIRRAYVARTDVQIGMLGRLVCARCLAAHHAK